MYSRLSVVVVVIHFVKYQRSYSAIQTRMTVGVIRWIDEQICNPPDITNTTTVLCCIDQQFCFSLYIEPERERW